MSKKLTEITGKSKSFIKKNWPTMVAALGGCCLVYLAGAKYGERRVVKYIKATTKIDLTNYAGYFNHTDELGKLPLDSKVLQKVKDKLCLTENDTVNIAFIMQKK